MKLYIVTVLIATFTASVIADPSISIGAGMNASTITGSSESVNSSSLRIGYLLDLGLEQNITEHFSLRTGVSFESRGESNSSSNQYEEYSDEQKEKLEIFNLQIPVLAQFNFHVGMFCINVFGGPELGIFLNGIRKSEITSNFPADGELPARSHTEPDTTDFSRAIKMLDGGVRIGAGFEAKTGVFGAVYIRPSAYIGLVDILQTGHELDGYGNLCGKHQTFNIEIGYKFNIRQKMNDVSDYKTSEKPKTSESSSTGSNLDAYRNYNTDSQDESSFGL